MALPGDVYGARQPRSGWTGSPPRVRGGSGRGPGLVENGGFTPACAGRIRSPGSISGCSSVHPRVCGADSSTVISVSASRGSPPRVRGGLHIPGPLCRARAVHPRVCGADFTRVWGPAVREGSPPRVRGGSEIPSPAGKNGGVHPRVCGADTVFKQLLVSLRGSPPRVRGGYRVASHTPRGIRFTPACAGRISGCSQGGPNRRVHPRVCGADGDCP